jgi:proteasome lid subunit RPN8/RPN11
MVVATEPEAIAETAPGSVDPASCATDGSCAAGASCAVDAAAIVDPPALEIHVASPPPAPPDAKAASYQPIVKQSVLDQVREHGESEPEVEVCGVLIGSVYENPTAALVYVDDCIRGNHASGKSTQVTFTTDTWDYIHKVMEQKHPGKQIVGWYHTHPGFGIFLSEMDLFIHRNFFSAHHHVAYVYDPQSRERGLFSWRNAQVVPVDFMVDDGTGAKPTQVDAQHAASATEEEHVVDAESSAAAAAVAVATQPRTISELAARLQTLERRQRLLLVSVALAALIAIAWPLGLYLSLPTLERLLGVKAVPTNSAPENHGAADSSAADASK